MFCSYAVDDNHSVVPCKIFSIGIIYCIIFFDLESWPALYPPLLHHFPIVPPLKLRGALFLSCIFNPPFNCWFRLLKMCFQERGWYLSGPKSIVYGRAHVIAFSGFCRVGLPPPPPSAPPPPPPHSPPSPLSKAYFPPSQHPAVAQGDQ